MFRKLLWIFLILVGASGLGAQEFSLFYVASPNGTLTWCRCPDDPYGGLPRRASAIKGIQQSGTPLLILDAGDLLAPFPSHVKDSVFVEAYARIPLDAVAFGDQELIDGYDFFARKMKDKLPFVSLNIYRDGKRLVKPYIVKEVGGVRVVITSLFNKNAFSFYEPASLGGVSAKDPVTELGGMMAELTSKGDVIILLSHLGLEEERKIAKEFEDIDIIVSGHTPGYLVVPEKVSNAYILGAGADAKHFGLARFRFEADSVTLLGNEIFALSDRYAEEPSLSRMIAPYIEAEEVQLDSSLIKSDTVSARPRTHSPVPIDVFYAPDCDHCIKVLKGFLPQLAKRHPGLFTLKLHNIDKNEEYFLLEKWESEAKDLNNDIPVLFFDGYVLGGEEEVTRDLERLLLELRPGYSSQDSIKFAAEQSSWQMDTAGSALPDTNQPVTEGTREIVFFETYGCKECDRVSSLLKGLISEDSTLSVKTYGIEDPEGKTLLAAFGKVYKLSENKRLLTPVVFVGNGFLLQSDITLASLKNLLEVQDGRPIPWKEIDKAKAKGSEEILKEFQGFRLLPIIGAGLLDGINPCAFATLIFFITYLSVLGVERKRVIWVAIPFIFSVFATYFVLGIIAYQILALLTVLRWVSRIIIAATVVFLIVLAVLSFTDFLHLRRGEGEKMKLKMPDRIRKRMNRMIRKRTSFGGFVVGAVVTGFFVSLFELICTGQVYLPTLVYVVQVSELRGRALLYLLIYNVAFIIPLVIVFLLVRFGMTEKHLQTFLTRRAGLTKILTALLFLVLAGLMGYFLIKGVI